MPSKPMILGDLGAEREPGFWRYFTAQSRLDLQPAPLLQPIPSWYSEGRILRTILLVRWDPYKSFQKIWNCDSLSDSCTAILILSEVHVSTCTVLGNNGRHLHYFLPLLVTNQVCVLIQVWCHSAKYEISESTHKFSAAASRARVLPQFAHYHRLLWWNASDLIYEALKEARLSKILKLL